MEGPHIDSGMRHAKGTLRDHALPHPSASSQLNSPVIAPFRASLGSHFELKGITYERPGGGRTESEDVVRIERIEDCAGREWLLMMVLDGVTSRLDPQKHEAVMTALAGHCRGMSGSRVAAELLSVALINELQHRAGNTSGWFSESITAANQVLDALNLHLDLREPGERVCTTLSLAALSADGATLRLAQVGDTRIYLPQKGIYWEGDQEVMGEVKCRLKPLLPEKTFAEFVRVHRSLCLNNPNEESVRDITGRLIREYGEPVGYTPELPRCDLRFSCLNGKEGFLVNESAVDMDKDDTLVLCSDGIVDGLNGATCYLVNAPPFALAHHCNEIRERIDRCILTGAHKGLKQFGDDEGMVIVRRVE